MTRRLCYWCDEPATWCITETGADSSWNDYACDFHKARWQDSYSPERKFVRLSEPAEIYVHRRGFIAMTSIEDGRIDWRAYSHDGVMIDSGIAGNKAYAIADGCISLVLAECRVVEIVR